MILSRYILPENPRSSDTARYSFRRHGRKEISSIRKINNWIRNSMLTDLLGNIAILAMHGLTILILKTYMQCLYENSPS